MSDPYLGEIRIFSFDFAPVGWAFCNGQVLPINQNQALFSILGTFYGGNGQTTFALPNLQERVPIHVGSGFPLGAQGGEATHTLITAELPQHAHPTNASSSPATANDPTGNYWASGQANFASDPPSSPMNAACVSMVGGSQSHENRSPYLVLNFCIAMQGVFPSQN